MAKSTKTKNSSTAPAGTQPDVVASKIMNHRKRWMVFGFILVGLLLLGGLGAGAVWYYHDRALPSVALGSIDVGNKTKDQINTIVASQTSKMKITFAYDGKPLTANMSELGVNVDVSKSVQQALQARRDMYSLDLWDTRSLPLAYTADVGVFKEFIKQHFPSIVVDAQDAQLVFDSATKKYDIQPGSAGKGFDLLRFTKAIDTLASNPQTLSLPVATSPVQPLIRADALSQLQEKANQQITASLRFNYQGKLVYSAEPSDIAGWANFTPDPVKGSASITFDAAKVKQFLSQKVGPSIAAPAVDRKVIHDNDTNQDVVIQQGQIGRQLDDIDGLVNKILDALNKNQPLETELAITTAPFKTVNLAGSGRWIEVDLSEQRTNLWLGSTKVASFLISSGVSWAPTVQGEFYMRYKTASQTMTGGSRASGDYYYLPGVTWVSYFYQDYSFHTAYWHNNFGHPMSHGCVNMRYNDAKALYDFAPIGTKVIVHG